MNLDLDALTRWIKAETGLRGPFEATKFATGQSNPTYRLKGPHGAYVLRRKPPRVLLKSAHAVDREFRVQKALADSAVPVARMHALCEDDSIIGSAFYVMDHVEGRLFFDPSLPEEKPAARAAIYEQIIRVLTAIHEWLFRTAIGAVDQTISRVGNRTSAGHGPVDRWVEHGTSAR